MSNNRDDQDKREDNNNDDEEQKQQEIAEDANVVIAFIVTLVMISCLMTMNVSPYTRTATTGGYNVAHVATKIVERDPMELGTYGIESIYGGAGRSIITYKDESETKTITVKSNNLSREVGEDNTVKISEIRHDKVNAKTNEIVTENYGTPEYSAVVYYDSDRIESAEYTFVSLEKNGSNLAKLTYSEAGGVTDTISVPPNSIEVVADGAGYVTRVDAYNSDGIWQTHWTVHAL